MLRLVRLHRTVVGIPQIQPNAGRLVITSFPSRYATSSVRQVHASVVRHALKKPRTEGIKPTNATQSSSVSRYVQGPTMQALKIVIQTLKDGGRMHSKDIWAAIHPNSDVTKDSTKYEPEYPSHPVRSVKYLKAVLIKTLETNGRIAKVKTTQEVSDEQGTVTVDHWVWELTPVQRGEIPLEELTSISKEELDAMWRETLQSKPSSEQEGEGEEWAVTPHRGSRQAASGNTIEAQSWSVEGGHSDRKRVSARQKREAVWTELSEEEQQADQEYANKLGAKWRDLTRHSRRVSMRPVTSSHPVDWKDPEAKRAKEQRRKEMETARSSSLRTPSNWTQGGGLVPVVEGQKPKDSPDSGKSTNAKPWLNPNEPEYRQSRLGINDVPIGLKDPRRRQYGFNYGLPKQKELLRAANARDWDQKEWSYQPPHDISHLNTRRQRGREKGNIQLSTMFKKASRVAHEKRTGANGVKLTAPGDDGKGRWGPRKEA